MTNMTIKDRKIEAITEPTGTQIKNAELMGWTYCGKGEFLRGEGEHDIEVGTYTTEGFKTL